MKTLMMLAASFAVMTTSMTLDQLRHQISDLRDLSGKRVATVTGSTAARLVFVTARMRSLPSRTQSAFAAFSAVQPVPQAGFPRHDGGGEAGGEHRGGGLRIGEDVELGGRRDIAAAVQRPAHDGQRADAPPEPGVPQDDRREQREHGDREPAGHVDLGGLGGPREHERRGHDRGAGRRR